MPVVCECVREREAHGRCRREDVVGLVSDVLMWWCGEWWWM